MYGGGVETGAVDRYMPIRASAIRGHLRFWWRLLNDVGRTSKDLFSHESALWGGISSTGPQASRVMLQIKADPVEPRHMVRFRSRPREFPAYALILEREDDPELLNTEYGFELVLRFERTVDTPQREQVIEALRWWASFGGVGARCRRGLGAVNVTSDDTALTPVSTAEVEQRSGRMIVGRPASHDAVTAWRTAIETLRRFRQGPGVGRNPGREKRPGRSRWPEPDTIRRFSDRHAPGHEPRHPVKGWYPRAAFGLPLVFHFKDGGDPFPRNRGAAQEDNALKPRDSDRMASPLILRPWFDGSQYCPAAMLLSGWEKRISIPVRFGTEAAEPAWPEAPFERARLAAQIEPIGDSGTDALSAFMAYFEHECGRR